MTALMAPSRGGSFEGIVFFVYDREAVKKEADPPEDAIIYFYPPSASIEERISICGQLIGMSHFMQSFIGARPALFKLETEKMATRNSGKYTLALGGGLSEPDSLLIRQLETLHSIFTFYHGSLDRMRMMCDSQRSFLLLMNVIWDCYLPFVRHYGDFLPGVFDPLPFLDLPKSVAATCFTKASYILQACQRRQHVLGGCILYSNSILCTQLEPSITERLLLLKPNQSNHPARPVKTECDLPFGVRILNAFLTLSEYLNLYEALAQSPYQKPGSAEGDGTFPDLYTLPTTSSATGQDSVSMQSDESVGKRLDDSKAQESNANSEVSSSGEELSSSVSKQSCSLVNSEASLESSTSFPECSTVNSAASVESSISYPEGCDCAEISPAERKGVEKEFDDEGYSTTQEVVLTSSVTESSSSDSPTMDAIDITGLKVVKCCFDNFPKRSSSGDWENKNVSTPSKAPSYLNKKRAICSNCREADTCTDDATRICALVMEDLIKHVEQAAEEEKASRDEKLPAGVSSTLPHCQSCTVAVEANLVPRIETKGPWERGCEEGPRLADTPCLSDNEASLLEQKAATTEPANSKTVDECLETTSMAPPTDSQETRSSFGCDGEELNCRRQTNTTVVTDSGDTTDVTSNEAIHLRTDVLKTPIVCDSFSSRNLNIGVEKTLEKSFPFSNSSSDFASESETLSSRSQNSSDDVITEGVASGDASPSLISVEPVPVVHVTRDEFDTSPVHTALEGAGAQVDAAQEETEDSSSRHESLLDSGRTSPSSISREEEEVVFNEEEEHGTNQVEGLTHVNLYVQAHSQVVLILLAEDMLYKDFNSIKALWDTSLNELGELEFLVKQSLDNPPKPAHTDEYSFLVYDSFERNMKGSLGEPVFKLDHSFCETTKVMYEQFDNCPSLKDITLRSRSSTVYGKRNLGRGTYFHLKGSYRAVQGVPSPRDPAWTLEKRASKLLHKEHGVNVF